MRKLTVLLCLFMLLCLVGCGSKPVPETTEVPSSIYTDEEIRSAIDAAKDYFRKEFSGCTLTGISYAGDETSLAHQDWADRNNADEVIVLTSSFDVDCSGGDGSLNPNSTYSNWMWIMIRTNCGPWQHADHGY